jgi:anti-anti-sigma factor
MRFEGHPEQSRSASCLDSSYSLIKGEIMSLTTRIDEKIPGYYIAILKGRLDGITYSECEKTIDRLLVPETKALMFDMSDLEYISSMGLRVVMKARKKIEGDGGYFNLINLKPQIAKVFEIANMLPGMNLFASVEEADHYFDLMQKKVLESDQP